MFVKRDYRKIELILADKEKDRSLLKLSNRKEEFQGKIQVLCREAVVANCLAELKTLNLYANDIEDLAGIGLLSSTPLEELNLGNNKLSLLPPEIKELMTLKVLYLEDNEFVEFPNVLFQLTSLVELRLSNNSLSSPINESFQSLTRLQLLALDNNELEEFPLGILDLPLLKELWLRQNKLTSLPENLDLLEKLEILSVSSNAIKSLPPVLARMKNLRQLFANHNSISSFDSKLLDMLALQSINLANNFIAELPTHNQLDQQELMLDHNSGILVYRKNKNRMEDEHFKESPLDLVTLNLNGNPLISTK